MNIKLQIVMVINCWIWIACLTYQGTMNIPQIILSVYGFVIALQNELRSFQ